MSFNYSKKPNEEQCILAHDLNNDLTAILGRCELLGDLLSTNTEAAKHLRIIETVARHMIERVEDAPHPAQVKTPATTRPLPPRRAVNWTAGFDAKSSGKK